MTLTKLQLQGWRQRGYELGRFRRGMSEESAQRLGGEEAVAAFRLGRRCGDRDREGRVDDLVETLNRRARRSGRKEGVG